jgi:hypothetical protein
MRLSEIRLEGQSLPIAIDRFVELALLLQDKSQIVRGLGKLGRELEGQVYKAGTFAPVAG